MRKNLLKLLLVLSFIHTTAFAQQFKWAHSFSTATHSASLRCTSSDSSGNVAVIGSVDGNGGNFDINPGAGVNNINTTLGSSFIAKYNAQGAFIWGNNVKEDATNGWVNFYQVRINPANGNVYVFGQYQGAVNLDMNNPNNSAAALSSGGMTFFFAVYNGANGNFIGVYDYEIYGGYVHTDGSLIDGEFYPYGEYGGLISPIGYTIEFDKNGRLLIAGAAAGYVDFDVLATGNAFTVPKSWVACFYDEQLNLVDVVSFGSDYDYRVTAVSSDRFNNWYILAKTNNADKEMMLLKADTAVNIKWIKETPMSHPVYISATDFSTGTNLATDSKGNVYISGVYKGTLDLDFSPTQSHIITNSYISKSFVARYDSSGAFKWGHQFGSTNGGMARVQDMKVNSRDELVVFVDLYEGNNQNPTINIKNNTIDTTGSFLVIYDSLANLKTYNKVIGSSNIPLNSMSVYGDLIRLCGAYSSNSITFQQGVSGSVFNNANSYAGFLVQYNSCAQNVTSVNAVICSGETYTINGQNLTQSGNYTINIPLSGGCDSVVNLSLNVLPVIDTTVVLNNNTLQAVANNPAYTYQWIDCVTNQVIAGANSRSFAGNAQGGTFKVKITQGNCTYESGCHTLSPTGMKEVALNNIAAVFPNPVQGRLDILFNQVIHVDHISITGLNGVTVWSSALNEKTKARNIDVSQLAVGTYIIRIATDDKQYVQKFVKQ